MRRLNMHDFEEIDRMTLGEYRLRMKASALRDLDADERLAKQAWMNREIGAKKKTGKDSYDVIYKRFDKFFDAKSRERAILGLEEYKKKPSTIAERYREYMRRKDGDIQRTGGPESA